MTLADDPGAHDPGAHDRRAAGHGLTALTLVLVGVSGRGQQSLAA
jgi:hypothetical protein